MKEKEIKREALCLLAFILVCSMMIIALSCH
jgi:hypothetical protein